jgi:transposase
MTQACTTELTLEQYELLASLLPPETGTGRPRTVNMMSVIQGILYVLVSSCAWRLMPKEYPPSSTVYYYFSKWRNDGSWKRINEHLVEWVRIAQDRDPSPSVASIDSQTVPTAVMVSDSVGYDAGKKTKGRKRFTMVDTLGLLLMVKVVAADIQERDGAKQLLTKMNEERHRVPRLVRIWFVDLWSAFGNGGFSGPDFLHWVMDICHWIVDVVLRPNGSKGFVLLPKRWTVVGEACRRHENLRLAALVSSSQR